MTSSFLYPHYKTYLTICAIPLPQKKAPTAVRATSKFGNPRDPAKVSLKCKKLATTIGRPDFTMHDTRHTHATLLLEPGVNFKVVQMRLDHSSYQQTIDTYSHVTPIMESDVVEKISNIF